jgi:hypothetical protein
MKHQSLVLLILAAFITLASVIFLASAEVIGAICGAFLATASAYTALDLRAMVKSTQGLPEGQYQKADVGKYYLAMGMMAVLFVACLIRQNTSDLSLDLSMGLLGPGIVGLIAIVIGGMKFNKAATGLVIEAGSPEEDMNRGTSIPTKSASATTGKDGTA